MNLVPGVLAHVEPPHPHVRQQELGTGVRHEGPQVGGDGQLQAGGVAPVLQLVGEQLHGHGLGLLEGLLQQVHRQRPKLTETQPHVDQWVSRTINQISMTNIFFLSRCIHEKVSNCSI